MRTNLQEPIVTRGGAARNGSKKGCSHGLTIVGHGTDPLGHDQAWVVTIPEPSGVVLAGIAIVGLAGLVRRRPR